MSNDNMRCIQLGELSTPDIASSRTETASSGAVTVRCDHTDLNSCPQFVWDDLNELKALHLATGPSRAADGKHRPKLRGCTSSDKSDWPA